MSSLAIHKSVTSRQAVLHSAGFLLHRRIASISLKANKRNIDHLTALLLALIAELNEASLEHDAFCFKF
jgi:hypothetical protein